MSARTAAARLGWFLLVLSVLLFVPALVLNLRRPQYTDLAFTTGELLLALAVLLFGWFGALIVSRQPRHPVGWVLCAFGVTAGWAPSSASTPSTGCGAIPAPCRGPQYWPG